MNVPINERINIRASKAQGGCWKVVVEMALSGETASEMACYESDKGPHEFRAWRAMSLAEHYRSGYLDGHQKCGAFGSVSELCKQISVVPYRAGEACNAAVQLAQRDKGIVELARFYSFDGRAGTIAARRSTMLAEQYRRGYLDGYENRMTSSYLTGHGVAMVDLGDGDSAAAVDTFELSALQTALEHASTRVKERAAELGADPDGP
ncbi:MAG: hypothetical protein ACLPTJ_21580 [Solirubrobacteraceae bacterium]